ncbi:MAG: putative secreted protein [Chlamydiales bacterium]|jgi:hypothetical protein|nr:putative secreted protein [Chlamydiales bacterium]
MFVRNFLMYFIFGSIFFSSIEARIEILHTFHELPTYFSRSSSPSDEILGILDVDLVLTQPSDPAFQMATANRYAPILQELLQPLTKEQKHLLFHLLVTENIPILIEEESPVIVKKLQSDFPIIALTGSGGVTLNLDEEVKFEEWRLNDLRRLGFDFSNAFPQSSLCLDGILFSNGAENKGRVLINFLQEVKYKPHKIVFVDDLKENLESVEKILQETFSDIEFIGLYYVGATNYPSQYVDADLFRSKLQAVIEQTKKC